MNDRAKKLLLDVLNAATAIREWCAGRSFSDYEADKLFRSAVERQFEIIGEALSRLARSEPEVASQIEHLGRIVGFRNQITHGYDTLDDESVWGTISQHLPELIDQVSELLAE